MKKILIAVLALLLLGSTLGTVSAYAAEKQYAEQALEKIQTETGFIPGETAAVTGNCYGFIAAVCEKLYGVSYNGEELYDSYQCRHRTGNYYTVATLTTGSTPDTNTINSLIDFFIENAYPGDIVHYGSLTSSGSRHTIMIQSIDEEKMRFFHANYQTKQYGSSACHIDTIYWDSMRENFTSAIYEDGVLYSHNSIFYNKMKNGGLGISINRYTDYEEYFYPAGAAASSAPRAETQRISATAVKVKWNKINGAKKYEVQYRVKNTGEYVTAGKTKGTARTVRDLTPGTVYQFRVRAYVNKAWQEYGEAAECQVYAPAISSITFTQSADGLVLNWTAMDGISGVRVYRSTEADGWYQRIADITRESGGTSCTDTGVQYDTIYYYKAERYILVNGKSYGEMSEPFSARYTLQAPQKLSFHRKNATTVQVRFTGEAFATGFEYYVVRDGKVAVANTVTDKAAVTLKNLEPGAQYTFFCRARNRIGCSAYSLIKFVPLNTKVKNVRLSNVTDGIKVSYTAQADADGYYIYRSTKKKSGFKRVGTVKAGDVNFFIDTKVKYQQGYYYKVKAYSFNRSGKAVAGKPSAVSAKLTCRIAAPQQVKAVRLQPDAVRLSWRAVSNAAYYKISYKKVGGSWKHVSKITACSLDIAGLTLGEKYVFIVRGVNRFGSGKASAQVTKTVLPPAPPAPKATSGENGIVVRWRNQGWATAYRVYRSEKKKGSYRLLATVDNKQANSYVDRSAQTGKRYYYRIACVIEKDGKTYAGAKSAAVCTKRQAK